MTFRAPTPDDADRIVAMLIACDIADFGAPDYDRDALLAEWAHPGVDVERDAFVADRAYGILTGSLARGWVHPDARGRGLGARLAERLEERARERGLPYVDQQVPSTAHDARALLHGRGYGTLRSIAELRLDARHAGRLPEPGDAVRPYEPARDEAPLQALFERELAGGRGRVLPLEAVLAAYPDTSLWFCADAPGGSLAGGIRAELRPAGFITGYITQVAVEDAARGKGTGGALVGAAARELAARSADTVRVAVRSDTPDARRFFERLGFRGDWIVEELRLPLGVSDGKGR